MHTPKTEKDFYYHGTIRENLKSIMKHVLLVGGKGSQIWPENRFQEFRENSNKGVFLSGNIHMAKNWAISAYATSKGPRSGIHRQPIVIAIPVETVDKTYPDPYSHCPESYYTKNTVPIHSSYISMFPHNETQWMAVEDALKNKDKPITYPDA